MSVLLKNHSGSAVNNVNPSTRVLGCQDNHYCPLNAIVGDRPCIIYNPPSFPLTWTLQTHSQSTIIAWSPQTDPHQKRALTTRTDGRDGSHAQKCIGSRSIVWYFLKGKSGKLTKHLSIIKVRIEKYRALRTWHKWQNAIVNHQSAIINHHIKRPSGKNRTKLSESICVPPVSLHPLYP